MGGIGAILDRFDEVVKVARGVVRSNWVANRVMRGIARDMDERTGKGLNVVEETTVRDATSALYGHGDGVGMTSELG